MGNVARATRLLHLEGEFENSANRHANGDIIVAARSLTSIRTRRPRNTLNPGALLQGTFTLTDMPKFRRPRNVFYGWYLVGLSSFMLMLMSTTVFQGVGTFFVALERTFGWNRTTLSGAFALSRAEGALLGPLEGFLVDRLGTRRMVIVGYLVMGLGFIFYSQIQTVWHFYVAYIAISLGSGVGGWIAFVTLINNWFSRRRALAMSIAVSGIQLGGFLVPLMAWGIESHGFRMTALGIGIVLIVVAVPASRFIRNLPEDVGDLPDGAPAPRAGSASASSTQADSADVPDMTPRQALKTVSFWVIAVARLTSVVSIVSLSVHLVPKLTDSGISLITANFVVTLYTFVAFLTGFLAGYLADRSSKVIVLFVCMLLQALAMGILTFHRHSTDGCRIRRAVGGGLRRARAFADRDSWRLLRQKTFRINTGHEHGSVKHCDDFRAPLRRIYVRPQAKLRHTFRHLHHNGVHRRIRHSAGTAAKPTSGTRIGLPYKVLIRLAPRNTNFTASYPFLDSYVPPPYRSNWADK